jgi:hypothetical protein
MDKEAEPTDVMRFAEFDVDPEAAIDSAQQTGRPFVVTHHGRLLALVEPLDIEGAPEDTVPEE